jgi:hypothetical protein
MDSAMRERGGAHADASDKCTAEAGQEAKRCRHCIRGAETPGFRPGEAAPLLFV